VLRLSLHTVVALCDVALPYSYPNTDLVAIQITKMHQWAPSVSAAYVTWLGNVVHSHAW